MNEEAMLKKNDRNIFHQVKSYCARCNQPISMVEDLKSEATIAFINVARKWNFESPDLTPYQHVLTRNAIRSALRRYVWSANGVKDKNKSIDQRCVSFTDISAGTDSGFDDSKLDFLAFEDDYSAVEMRDLMERLPDVERVTLRLLIKGYSEQEISEILHRTPSTVAKTVNRLRTKLKDIA